MLPNPKASFNPQLLNLLRAFAWRILLEIFPKFDFQIIYSHDADFSFSLAFAGSSSVSHPLNVECPWALSSPFLISLHFCGNLIQHHDCKSHHLQFQIFQCLSYPLYSKLVYTTIYSISPVRCLIANSTLP